MYTLHDLHQPITSCLISVLLAIGCLLAVANTIPNTPRQLDRIPPITSRPGLCIIHPFRPLFDGYPPWSDISLGTFSPDASSKGTTSLCAPLSRSKGRSGMVEVFPPKLEWFLILPSPLPLCPCLLGCFWELWMWGCVDQLSWFQLQWPAKSADVDISVKELVPVVFAAAMWGRHWAGKPIRFHCSDDDTVHEDSKDPTPATLLLINFIVLFHFSAQHVPGIMNTAADAISRNNLPLFFSLVPKTPRSTIPPSLHELLISHRPDWGSPAWRRLFQGSLHEALLTQP